MRHLLTFFSLLLSTSLALSQNPCSCEPETDISNQHRSGAKHETHYGNFPSTADTITPSTLYVWEKIYKNAVKTIKTNPDNPSSLRKTGTPEDSLYILKGYMWFVKREYNDCDFHIEIGGKTKGSKRVIVEIKQENCALLEKVFDTVTSKGYKVINMTATNAKLHHFPKGIPCIVKGLGFYDASHTPNTNHGDKHTYRCTWELHPVKEIIFLE